MNKHRISFTLLLLALVPLLCSGATGKVTIVADHWAPVNCDPESDTPGYAVELAQHIFTQNGFDFEYRVLPWARALQEVRSGRYSAVIGAIEDDEGLLLPERPFGILENDFYTLAGTDWTYTGVASLADQKLGAIRGYEYGEIQAYIEDHKSTLAVQLIGGNHPLETNFRKLLANRITVLVDWAPVAEHAIRQHGWNDQVRHAGRGGNRTSLYLGFHPGRKDLAQIWDRGFEAVLADGTLDRILEKYDLDKESAGF